MGFLNIFGFGKEDNVDKMLIRILENFEGRLEFFESEIVELKNRNPMPVLEINKMRTDIQELCDEVVSKVINNKNYSDSTSFKSDVSKLALKDNQLSLEIDRISKQASYVIRNLKTRHYKQQQAAYDNRAPSSSQKDEQDRKAA